MLLLLLLLLLNLQDNICFALYFVGFEPATTKEKTESCF